MMNGGRLSPEGEERRKHPRHPCNLHTRARQIGNGSPQELPEGYFKLTAINISEGGILLEGEVDIPEGAKLEIEFELGGLAELSPHKVEAVRVVQKAGKFQIGVKFIEEEAA